MGNFTESTVVHTEFNNALNNRQWILDNHTASKPQLVIQKRRSTGPLGTEKLENELKVVFGAEDGNGALLPTNIALSVSTRFQEGTVEADLDAAIAEFQLLVASSLFPSMVKSQLYYG